MNYQSLKVCTTLGFGKQLMVTIPLNVTEMIGWLDMLETTTKTNVGQKKDMHLEKRESD